MNCGIFEGCNLSLDIAYRVSSPDEEIFPFQEAFNMKLRFFSRTNKHFYLSITSQS